MKPKIEKRIFKITPETRAINGVEKRVLVGMPIVYNLKSENFGTSSRPFYEIIQRGAATNALKNSDARALYDHGGNGTLPLGRESARTLELRETSEGVEATIFPPDTQFARDLLESVDRKDLREMSFAFYLAKDGDTYEMRGGEEWRTVKEFGEILDVSIVPFAAYPDTTIATETRDKWQAKLNATITAEFDLRIKDEQKNLEIDILTIGEKP